MLSKINNDTSPQKPNIEVSISIEIERDTGQDEESNTEQRITELQKEYRQCRLPESAIKETVLQLMQTSTTIQDKIIETEIRNYWGKFVQPTEEQRKEEYDSLMHEAVFNFKQWNYQSRVRENILSYKCYVCNIGWWRMAPFKDHIKQHKDLKINIEPYHHECCIVAFCGEQAVVRDVKIDGQCRYCLRSSSEHKDMKRGGMYYFCDGCQAWFFTCVAIFNHEGVCGRFQKILLQDNILTDCSECTICNVNCLTQKRYEEHLILRHCVRSDDPVTYNWSLPRPCTRCGLLYFLFTVHVCTKKYENISCKYCYRRFHLQWQLDYHLASNKKIISCKICCIGLRQCNESEHMLKHSNNYVMAYKCQRCDKDLFLLDEYSARKHWEWGHLGRSEPKMNRYRCVSI